MILSFACVIVENFWSSIHRDVSDRGENRCCGLSMGWNGRDSWIPSGVVDCHAQIC
jgi:hypothetical protein